MTTQTNQRGWARIAALQAAPHFSPTTTPKKRILIRHSSITSRWNVDRLRSLDSPGAPYFFIRRSGNIVQLVSLYDTAKCDLFSIAPDIIDIMIEGTAQEKWQPCVFNAVALVLGYIAQECRWSLDVERILYPRDLDQSVLLDPDFIKTIDVNTPKDNLVRLGNWIQQSGFWALWGDSFPLSADFYKHPIPRLWLPNAARLGRAVSSVVRPIEYRSVEMIFFEGGFIWGIPGRAYRIVWMPYKDNENV